MKSIGWRLLSGLGIPVTERIRLIAPNTLENRITVNDSVALTNPWEFAVQCHRITGMRHVIPLECKDDRPAR